MMMLCAGVLDGKGMPDDWDMGVVVPIVKGKGEALNCESYVGGYLLEDALKIVENVLEKIIRKLVNVDEMQFGIMPRKGTADAVFILGRLQDEYIDKESKLFICIVDLDKVFRRVPMKVMEWAVIKRGVPDVLVKAVMSLYEGAQAQVRVGSALSEQFRVKVGVHQ